MFELKDFYHLSEDEIIDHFLPVKDMELNILEEIVLYNNFFPILLRKEDMRFFDYMHILTYSTNSISNLLGVAGKTNWVFGDNWDKVPDSLKIKGVEGIDSDMSEAVAFSLLTWFIENYHTVKPQITGSNFYSSVVFYDFSAEFRSSVQYQEMVEHFVDAAEYIESSGYTAEQKWVEKQKMKEETIAATAWLKKDSTGLDSLELKASYFRSCSDLVVENSTPAHYRWVRNYICDRYLTGDRLNNFHTFSFPILLNIFLDDEVPITVREFINKKENITKTVSGFSDGKLRKMIDHLSYKKWTNFLDLFPEFKESILDVFLKETAYVTPNLYGLLLDEADEYVDDDYKFSITLIHHETIPEHSVWMRYKTRYNENPRYKQKEQTAEAKKLVEEYFGQKLISSSPEHIFSLLKTIVVEKMLEIAAQ